MKLTAQALRNLKAALSAKHPAVPFSEIRLGDVTKRFTCTNEPQGLLTYNLPTDESGADVRELTFNLK
jgi:hypothetical protein